MNERESVWLKGQHLLVFLIGIAASFSLGYGFGSAPPAAAQAATEPDEEWQYAEFSYLSAPGMRSGVPTQVEYWRWKPYGDPGVHPYMGDAERVVVSPGYYNPRNPNYQESSIRDFFAQISDSTETFDDLTGPGLHLAFTERSLGLLAERGWQLIDVERRVDDQGSEVRRETHWYLQRRR